MEKQTIMTCAVTAITLVAAIYQCVYTARYPKKGCRMRVLRTWLATMAITLIIMSGVAAVAISPWFILATPLGLTCGVLDRRLAKYDLDSKEDALLQTFLSLDVHCQNLILRAVELDERVELCEELDRPVSIGGSLYFKVEPLDLRELVPKGFLGDVHKETINDLHYEYFTILDPAREVARLAQACELVDRYGLMEEGTQFPALGAILKSVIRKSAEF